MYQSCVGLFFVEEIVLREEIIGIKSGILTGSVSKQILIIEWHKITLNIKN